MRSKITRIVGFLILLLLFTACHNEEKQDEQHSKPEVSADDVKKEVGEAIEATKDYVLQHSEEYRKELEQKLKKFDTQLEEWRAEVKKAHAVARARLEKEIAELEKKRELAQQKLEELKDPTKQAWEDLKSGLDSVMDELEKAFHKAADRFKNQEHADNTKSE
jgi:hypothetical protein